MSIVGVAGAGFMGSGIAGAVAPAGRQVVLQEPTQPRHERSRAAMLESLERVLARGRREEEEEEEEEESATVARVAYTADLNALGGPGVLIEAVVEDRAAKREACTRVSAAAPDAGFLTSNSSAIPIAELAAANDYTPEDAA